MMKKKKKLCTIKWDSIGRNNFIGIMILWSEHKMEWDHIYNYLLPVKNKINSDINKILYMKIEKLTIKEK